MEYDLALVVILHYIFYPEREWDNQKKKLIIDN